MKFNIIFFLFSFFFFSIAGWILEVVYRSIRKWSFVNPGLLKGPYLSLYGTGSLILLECIFYFKESPFLIKIIVYFIATTGLELVSAFIANYFFHKRLWDYSDQPLQYKGHVCVKFSIYWILLAFFFEYLLFPLYQNLYNNFSHNIKFLFIVVIFILMLVDFIFLCIKKDKRLRL